MNSEMLTFEELPKFNSARWLDLADLKGEVWKDSKYDLYEVSNYGRFKSKARVIYMKDGKVYHKKEKIMKIFLMKRGYCYVGITMPDRLIHRLVASAFVDCSDPSFEVDHINSNKQDNRAENLRWISHFENSSRANKGVSRKSNSMEHNPKAKKVVCVQNGEVVSIIDCAKKITIKYGINYSTLRQRLQKGKMTFNNVDYYYADNYFGKAI